MATDMPVKKRVVNGAGARRRSPRQDNRRARLLDAAAAHFAAKGFHGVSLREIAAEAGMLAGSIYYHFPSKEELLLAVYREGVRQLALRVDDACRKAQAPWARLEAALAAHAETLLEESDYARVILKVFPEDVPGAREELVELRDSYEARFRRMIEALDLPEEGDRLVLRFLLLGALNWSKAWYRPGALAPREIVAKMLDLVKRPPAGEKRMR